MSTISTHVLDTARGLPAQGIPVQLSRSEDSTEVGSGVTDTDGRISGFTSERLEPGTYQLRFEIGTYAAATRQEFFFPEVVVSFVISDERHYHVPLLLSPFAFSTYRGS